MKVCITGASGLLGHHLITALQAHGADIRALALPTEDVSRLEGRGVAIFRGDIRQPETLAAPIEGMDVVFHLAGMMGLWLPMKDYHDVNVTGAENVCRAAINAGVERVVHISSWTVYGMNLGRVATEDFPFNPFQEVYAISKTEGDKAVQRMIKEDGLRAVIVRPGTFFGPGDRLHYKRMADRVRNGSGLIVGNGRNALPFVYVTDVVQGLMLAAEHPNAVGEAFNITNDQPMTQQEFLTAIAEEIGARRPWLHVPYYALYAGSYCAERVGAVVQPTKQPIVTRLGAKLFGTDNRHSIDKARRLLGYEPKVSLREGVRLAAEWYQQQEAQAPLAAPAPAAPAQQSA